MEHRVKGKELEIRYQRTENRRQNFELRIANFEIFELYAHCYLLCAYWILTPDF